VILSVIVETMRETFRLSPIFKAGMECFLQSWQSVRRTSVPTDLLIWSGCTMMMILSFEQHETLREICGSRMRR
jgi:hypothetical protein